MFIATGAVILLLAVLGWLVYPKTKYAEKFTQKGFDAVEVGMSEAELRRTLGEPLMRIPVSKTWADEPEPRLQTNWVYSEDADGGPLDLGCWFKAVTVSNEVVIEKYDAFVPDLPWWR